MNRSRNVNYAAEAESLSLRCVLLLEQLVPVERAAFLLHHVFGRSRAETARMVGVSEATCQRLLRRVQRMMTAAKPTIEAERRERHDVTTRFVAAFRERDVQLLEKLLAPDAIAYTDATRTPTVGRRAVARELSGLRDLGMDPEEILLEVDRGLVQTVRRADRASQTREQLVAVP
jgi:Sigma-70, region 4